jgi:pimeloyl-ACP methyl ester carboxylesterase
MGGTADQTGRGVSFRKVTIGLSGSAMGKHMTVRALLMGALAVLAAGAALAQTPGLVTEEIAVQSTDPRIRLYVRNKRPADMKTFRANRTVLFIHGGTYPAETSFDLKLAGVSWMDYIAARGFDVYFVELRGYGRSGRPREMLENPGAHPPLVRGAAALDDIAVTVETVLARRKIAKLSLIGHDWGATLAASYASRNPGRVERLVLYAPQWILRAPADIRGGALGAYRLLTREEVREQRSIGVPESKKFEIFPAGWFETFADATWATDPLGAQSGQRVMRVPNGALQDTAESWAAGKPYYDPAKITAPTLLTVAEWDRDTPPYMAQTLLALLVNSPARRIVILPEGTHDIFMERGRNGLLQAVQVFLEEQGKP